MLSLRAFDLLIRGKGMSADMWRVPASKVKFGKAYSVIQDNGVLRHALPSSATGNYLFSEAGAGVMPLALIGLQHEIASWLAKHRDTAIENRIGELPDVYMGMCYYTPGQRYKGLFPLHDAAQQLVEGAVGIGGGFVPSAGGIGSMVASGGSAASDSVGLFQKIFGGKKKSPPKRSPGTHPVYILFSYLSSMRDKQMLHLGSGKVKFKDVEQTIIQAMKMV